MYIVFIILCWENKFILSPRMMHSEHIQFFAVLQLNFPVDVKYGTRASEPQYLIQVENRALCNQPFFSYFVQYELNSTYYTLFMYNQCIKFL